MRPGKIIVTFLLLVNGYAFGGVKEDIAKTIVRVRSGLKYSTGFFWKDGTTIVTTLHSISDKSDIEVYLPTISGWKKVTPVRVNKSADLVLLRVADFVSAEFISNRYTAKPQTDTKVFTIGYNAGNVAYQDRDFEVGLIQGNTLKDLLPESAEKEIRDIGFPALTTEIIYLKGQLLHGFSGSPIVDLQGKLIGIADGGLENGAAGISWCINANSVGTLENSGEPFPVLDQKKVNSLFASEEYSGTKETEGVRLGNFVFQKSKTRTFAELDRTGNYSSYREMGLNQLIAMLQTSGIPYNNFSYDIYVEQSTGATIVIPSGLELKEDNGYLTAYAPGQNFRMFVKLQTTDNAQASSVEFEQNIMRITNIYAWYPDIRLSYLYPLARPDHVMINRKAYYNAQFNKYVFEVLAAKERTFMGLFVHIDNGLNPVTLMFLDPVEAAKYNLAAQLTTFTN